MGKTKFEYILEAKYKGFDIAFKAMVRLIEKGYKDCTLEIVGGGNKENIEKQIND